MKKIKTFFYILVLFFLTLSIFTVSCKKGKIPNSIVKLSDKNIFSVNIKYAPYGGETQVSNDKLNKENISFDYIKYNMAERRDFIQYLKPKAQENNILWKIVE